jgi:tRNA(Glu) U13 pseudouridine synthase TruD
MNDYYIEAENINETIGLKYYSTSINGIGGVLKYYPEDFEVYEILTNGLSAKEYDGKIIEKIHGQGNHLLCMLKKNNIDFFL